MDKNNNKYSVILPTYNERENLPIIVYLILEMGKANKLQIEIVIVEDNSPDGTYEVAVALQKVFPGQIHILKRAGKLGLGSAYVDGLKLCTGNFVIIMDADFSHHPKFIPEFINRQLATDCDIVTGTRYVKGAGVHGWDLRRKLTSRVANYLASTMLGSSTSDLTGSFRLYKKQVIQKIMPEIQAKGYAFQMEIIMRANQYKFTIQEVPIIFVDRIFGESKLGTNEIVIYLKGVWKLFWSF